MTMSSSAYAGQSAVDGLYGKIRLGVRSSDELDVVSGKLVFGFKGKHDLDNGMQVSYGIEFEHDGADKEQPGSVTAVTNTFTGSPTATMTMTGTSSVNSGAALSNDKSWIAISGGFGKVIAGEHSDMAGFACAGTDLLTHGSAEACDLGLNTSPANAVQYRISSGAVDFGAAYTMDGTDDGNNTLLGIQFSGESWQVGAQFITADDGGKFGSTPAGESGSIIGGSVQLGNIGLGVTVGDSGAAVDGGGFDLGLYMPLGANGTIAIVYSDMDVDASDSVDLDWNNSLGGGAFWGIEYNSKDGAADDDITAYMGMNF